ncbi:MAG TPA: MtrAB system histidine kinase MtrB [Actinomycetes bacterium]|nr:MtrAB system histidine kinase MtrB [Actinomycetes bacterium]
MPRVQRAVRRSWRRSVALWRRSLQLRVVTTTTVFSLVAILVLGNSLITRVRDGLLDAKVTASLVEASTGSRTAQEAFDSADRSEAPAVYDTLVPDLVRTLSRAGGEPDGSKDVVLLRGPDVDDPQAPLGRSSFGADVDAVPNALRAQVQTEGVQQWTYSKVLRNSGKTVPVVVVGSPVLVPQIGTYELYFLFPLNKEEDTLGLVRGALLLAAFGLVVLVGGIAWLVTRQVVTPVRMAARIAERLSAGRLEERMRVRGEDDLARLAASFNRMASSLQQQIRQLEDLSRVQRRFVSDVSHELRTPLTTVRMAADVLHEARAGFDPAVQRSAEILQTQLDRFESLLADLLEISRYDAGAAHLDAEPTDVVGIVRHVIDAMETLADARGSELVLVIPRTPCVAEVDSRRIERILRNLVVNAIEHGDGRPVTVLVASDDDAVAVAVRDRGAGLAPTDVTMVFNRFWRADPARARTTGGTGLGLSIALEDAHLHDGWLQAWGAVGDGSQFRLTLPRRRGVELQGSPIPLEPRDSARRRPLKVGEPYRTVGAPGAADG